MLPAALCAQELAAPVSRDVLKLEDMKVTPGGAAAASDATGTEQTDVYSTQDIEESGVFDLDEFFAQLPISPAGSEQLVLVDGRPTYLNISDIPPEMVASIEVSNNGALPQYGAFANGRVINIRLKTNYRGEFLRSMVGGSFVGDGISRQLAYAGMVSRGKLRAFYALTYRKQDALLASDRSFSRNQDHTALGGRDLRLLWGEDAVVQAVSGNLAGVLDANGQPTSVALAPTGSDGRGLTPADFLSAQVFAPASVATAAGQRRFNTADFVMLTSPSESKSATFNLSRTFGKKGEISLNGGVTRRDGHRTLAPPVTSASRDTLVPAAYNPFGQDVEVGLVHPGFGPVRQNDRNTTAQLGLSVVNQFSDAWQWHATLGSRWGQSRQEVRDLDRAALAAALASPDPARRFNPFGDDPINAQLYPELAVLRTSGTDSASLEAEAFLRGEFGQLKGGPMRLTLRGQFEESTRDRSYENPTSAPTGELHRRDNSQSLHAGLSFPWFGSQRGAGRGGRSGGGSRGGGFAGGGFGGNGGGRRAGGGRGAGPAAWSQRLETSVDTTYATRSSIDGGTLTGRFGVNWAPIRALSLRANYDVTQHAPSRFIADAAPLTGETLIDPLRSPSTTADVFVTEHDFEGAVRARSERKRLSATFEAPAVPGLQFVVSYDDQQREDLTSSEFRAQDLIYNELTFPGRVVRAAPTADDLRLGQPGRIISVDTTPSDRATQESSGLTWQLSYRRRSEQLGMFNFSASARQSLTSRYELVPGVPFVFESDNDLNPPDWTLQTRASWSQSGWRISANYRFVDEVRSGTIVQAATHRLGLQFGYRFTKPIWRGWGRGTQVAFHLENLIEGTPPFADTINGYRAGSPLGRAWSLSLRVPLQAGQGRDGGRTRESRGGAGMSEDDDD
ncbi:MAG TPA: hypothetical protein VG734_20320 [Lacunisphaera sp.]|nr:hypothetical protein [Lacunisphaera sp.]